MKYEWDVRKIWLLNNLFVIKIVIQCLVEKWKKSLFLIITAKH
jgi:hypothetical protein